MSVRQYAKYASRRVENATAQIVIGTVMVRGYQELVVWQKAMDFVTAIYEKSKAFPANEMYGLTNQLRRSAVSVPANIAEGQGRSSTREFGQILSIAHGSSCEAETHIHIARRLSYLPTDQADHLLDMAVEIGRLINALSRSLNRQ